MKQLKSKGFSLMLVLLLVVFIVKCTNNTSTQLQSVAKKDTLAGKEILHQPELIAIPSTEEGTLIQYGRNLISNTSYYLGPKGTVAHITNGMNCQNCHLEAGTKTWGNNYNAVYATYPKFRERSGTVESIFKRVNYCVVRSLNGKALDSTSKEMQAILVYIKWLGREVPQGTKPYGSGLRELPFLDRSADPIKGESVYIRKCQQCHSYKGEGKKTLDSIIYLYPPLWGEHSYTLGAGLFRLGRFAGYVKDNMPYGSTFFNPQLTDEEAWDVAAFVNSQPRPGADLSKDWPNISTKPFDYPFAPYTDGFSATQHKYGPYLPIKKAKDEIASKNKK